MYDFDEIIERRNSHCAKWDEVEKGVLPMWVADMDFKCPPEIIKALQRRVDHGIFGYSGGLESYFEAIINWMKKRHNWDVKKEWISSSPGIVPALDMLVRALTDPGDKVLIQTPVYYPFYKVINNNNRLLVENPLKFNGSKYEMDFADLEQKLVSGAKMIILCSPHNPGGRVWSREELKQLGDLCLKYKTIIVADEIHSDLVFPEYKHTVFSSISEELAQNSVLCNAPSKTFNIAGIQASTIIIPNKEIRTAFRKVINNNGLAFPNVFAVTALEAAYNYGEAWLEEMLVYLKANYDYLKYFIEKNIPVLKVFDSEGTYLVWVDFSNLGLNNEELDRLILEDAKLKLSPGHIFGTNGSGFQRINIACPRSVLKDGLNRLKAAVNSQKVKID